ncbi:MAG: peptide deformylase [Planctomycetota bacterium]|nr:peptide deformylase [Planctomycetota bacterium]
MSETWHDIDIPALRILRYPDPRLRKECAPITSIDGDLRRLVDRMFELMFDVHGVGLAAPQVGVTVRLFVACPTGESDDRRVYINPRITSLDGSQEGEEGCLSFPGIYSKIKRADLAVIEAHDIDGRAFEETGQGLTARIFQHECEHLDGRLLVDRMGTVSKLANRRALKELEEKFASTPR